MIGPKLMANLKLWYAAFVVALTFLVGTGLVTEWGNWYSRNIAYREQTEAFFRKSLALHDTPSALRNDLVWYDGGVQQVWGLGVPLWRWPFECLAKICGEPAFPDRLAFGAALMVLAFWVFKILLQPVAAGCASAGDFARKNPLRLVSAAVLLIFPPFVVMCHYRFDVYEEASAYSYLYGVGLFIGLVAFTKNPTRCKFVLVSTLAGLAPMVRPTLGAYGFITVVLLSYLARKTGYKWWQMGLGVLLFTMGGLAVFTTNQIRFGSGFEFGHAINFNGFPLWIYDHIYNPYQKEPLLSAARELFGAYFCDSRLIDLRAGMNNIFWGQSFTPRWRNLYLSCYDLSFLFLLLAFLALWFSSLMPRFRKVFALSLESQLAGLWSMVSIALFWVFYLRLPVLSNRYVFDSGPAMAVAIVGLLLGLETIGKKPYFLKNMWCPLVAGTMVLWLGLELFFAHANTGPFTAVNESVTMEAVRHPYPLVTTFQTKYEAGIDATNFSIPYNRIGWDRDGRMATMAIFFVEDPDYIEIHVAPINWDKPFDFTRLQAKIGLEFLAVESIEKREVDCVIRFKAPHRQVYRKGIQVLFLACLDKSNISSPLSPIRLLKVQWKD